MTEHAGSGLQRPRGDGLVMVLFGGISLLLLLVGLVAVALSTRSSFAFSGLAVTWTRFALLACAVALPLSARSPDLSVFGVAAVGGVGFAAIGGLPGLVVGLVVGAALGAANGALVGLLRLHPAICTLAGGVGLSVLAVAVVTATGQLETVPLSALVPASVLALVFLAAAVTDGSAFFARPPRLSDAARRFSMHVVAGALAGLAGAVGVSHLGVAAPGTITGTDPAVLVTALAAAVLGGTSATGGRRCLLGAVFAAGSLATLFSLTALLDVSPFLGSVVSAVVLVLALGGDRLYDWCRRRPVPHSTGFDASTPAP